MGADAIRIDLDRLDLIMRVLGWTPRRLSREMEYDEGNISRALRGLQGPGPELIAKLLHALNKSSRPGYEVLFEDLFIMQHESESEPLAS